VLEQIVFTDLRLPAHIADANSSRRWMPAITAGCSIWPIRWMRVVLSVSWEASVLPPGFHMTVSARQVLHSGPVEHLVFTDGLASVSVFVEIGRERRTEQVAMMRRPSAPSSAYSTVVQGYRVTAVGEVPPDTVRAIAQSIRTARPGAGVGRIAAGHGDRATLVRHTDGSSGSIFDELPGAWQSGSADPASTTCQQLPRSASAIMQRPGRFGAARPGHRQFRVPPRVRAGIEHARPRIRAHPDTADPCRVRAVRRHAAGAAGAAPRDTNCRRSGCSTSTPIRSCSGVTA
jgi:hypothetical protein